MELVVYAQLLEEAPTILLRNLCFEKLDVNAIYTHLKEEKTPNVELKTLPSNLRFHQKVLGYTLDDIKAIQKTIKSWGFLFAFSGDQTSARSDAAKRLQRYCQAHRCYI